MNFTFYSITHPCLGFNIKYWHENVSSQIQSLALFTLGTQPRAPSIFSCMKPDQLFWCLMRALIRGLEYIRFFSNSSSSRRRLTTSLGFKVSGLKFPPEITIRWIYTKADQNVTTRPFPYGKYPERKKHPSQSDPPMRPLDTLFLFIHPTGSSRLFIPFPT